MLSVQVKEYGTSWSGTNAEVAARADAGVKTAGGGIGIPPAARKPGEKALRSGTSIVVLACGGSDRMYRLSDVSGLTPSLTALDQLILSFVHNPVFKDAGVVDTKLGGKARRDLDIIIEVSDKVRKIAERMRKNTGK